MVRGKSPIQSKVAQGWSLAGPARLVLSLVGTLLFGPPLWAQPRPLERTFAVGNSAVVHADNLNGRVSVRAWNQPRVRVRAVQHSRAVDVHIEQSASYVNVRTHLLQGKASEKEKAVDYEIWAPPTARLLFHLQGGTLEVENFARDVTVDALMATVTLRNLSGPVVARTLDGSIRAENCSGHLKATSISGNLYLLENQSRSLLAETTSGNISFVGDFQPGGDYKFVNHEGEIDLLVPWTASFELDASSANGTVVNELPFQARSHGRVLPPAGAQTLMGTVHSGAAAVEATSFSGSIRLRKQPTN